MSPLACLPLGSVRTVVLRFLACRFVMKVKNPQSSGEALVIDVLEPTRASCTDNARDLRIKMNSGAGLSYLYHTISVESLGGPSHPLHDCVSRAANTALITVCPGEVRRQGYSQLICDKSYCLAPTAQCRTVCSAGAATGE